MRSNTQSTALAAGISLGLVSAQQCTSTISASDYPAPSLAPGWGAHIIANDFVKPRSLRQDNNGHLLVVDQDDDAGGIIRLTHEGEGPCLTVSDRQQIIANGSLNHGIELSPDNSILYASSQEAVYAWPYDPETGDVTGEARRVVSLGGDGSHSTRTLLLPSNDPDYLLISWGSDGNRDPQAREPTSGYSSVKAFDITNTSRVWDYASEGTIVGWGLRNSIGLAQNPIDGGLWSNENSIDNLNRSDVSIVEDNPAEELNFHGYLNGTEHPNFGAYYGYPDCFSVWDLEDVPDNGGLTTGMQFAATTNETVDDAWCRDNTVDPRLSFTAHMAPMDMEFNSAATTLFITFRGSWNRESPAGYKLAAIAFDEATGMPVQPADSMEPYTEIMSNEDESRCPDECFRPVGLEWSAENNQLFMAADASGEIYIVYQTDGTPVDDFTVAATQTGGGESGSETDSDGSSESGAPAEGVGSVVGLTSARSWLLGLIALVAAFVL